MATVKFFAEQGLQFPRRVHTGTNKGDTVWGGLEHSRVLRILHNPRYTGAFVYGRTHTRKTVEGDCVIERVPREEWEVLIRDKYTGYIGWDEYERNQRRLQDNCQAYGADRRKSPPREGPALLQGLLICGCCGKRMTVRYHSRRGQLSPDYVCQREGIEHAEPICQHIPGSNIDEAVGNILVETITPVALEVALAVQQELQSRLEEADQLRRQQVERTRYEAELARRRYLRVDPLCVLHTYVISGREVRYRRPSSTIPQPHNYNDFKKVIRPASWRQRLPGFELPCTSQCASAAAFISKSASA
jgi:hypothetical protein